MCCLYFSEGRPDTSRGYYHGKVSAWEDSSCAMFCVQNMGTCADVRETREGLREIQENRERLKRYDSCHIHNLEFLPRNLLDM